MRVSKLHLTDFKRFHDLTIDLSGRQTRIVALVGPNGSGKSSVFDAFEEVSSNFKGRGGRQSNYFKKSMFHDIAATPQYEYQNHIELTSDPAANTYDRKSIYIRSAYRFTPRISVDAVRKLADVEEDGNRPKYLIDTDVRLQDNYERLISRFYDEVYDKDVTGKKWSQDNIDGLNAVLEKVLEIKVSSLGNPAQGQGTLYFEKGLSKKFPYEILSAGEKEVIDLVLDLYVKKEIYTNSIICIDEPELHISTAIQRKLLIELEKLIPENSQLWVATHSIGFLRALQEDLWAKTAVIDFTGSNFDAGSVLKPITGTRSDWSKIFATALEDLTGLLAPKTIVYCEGRSEPTPAGQEQGLDAEVYNQIFAETHNETLFVSSGGGDAQKNALLAIRVLGKALSDVSFFLLKDLDTKSVTEREAFLNEDASRRMLTRREIENYLFDKEVLIKYCALEGTTFDEARYDALVTDLTGQDLKPVQQQIQAACGKGGSVDEFKRSIAKAINSETRAYIELVAAVF